MQEKCYRSAFSTIPEDQSLLKTTAIPLFFSVEFEKENHPVPLSTDAPVRCSKCRAYLNPYVEVIMPGYKWKCNLCTTLNEVEQPFAYASKHGNSVPDDPIRNASYNRESFLREDLKSDIYEIEAPDSSAIKTPEPPVLCFLIEVTTEALRLGLLKSVFPTICEVLQNVEYDSRTRICFILFSDNAYLLNNNGSISIISDFIPLVLKDKILFSLYEPEDGSSHPHYSTVDFANIELYLQNKKTPGSNLLLPLKIAHSAFRSASLFLFFSTLPSVGSSALESTPNLQSRSSEYKSCAESLRLKNICVNLFVMARTSVELSEISYLAQLTGGAIYHYSNYDGSDPTSVSKLYYDLSGYHEKNIGFGAMFRVRSNEGVVIRSAYGNFHQRSNDLFGYANYIPSHVFNFTISPLGNLKPALYLQLAMLRITKQGKRMFRIFNICVPLSSSSFYDGCDPFAICHALILESFYYESRKKQDGCNFLAKATSKIWTELKSRYGRIPDSLQQLPQLITFARKTVPLRPDFNTPSDFRVFYMYLFANSYIKLVDLLICPMLLDISAVEVTPLALSLSSIQADHTYLLDTGINLFFYVGKECETTYSLFEGACSGPIIFSPPNDELSNYVSELLVYLLKNRPVAPKYVLVLETEDTIYRSIFLSYLYDDKLNGLPSTREYYDELSALMS